MPREIPLYQMPPAFGGVLIKRKQLMRQRQSIDLVNDAQRQATRLVKDAQAQAEDIRRQAYHEGYQEGLVAAAAAVADYLTQAQRLGAELQQQINQHARRLLSNAMAHPDMLLELLDEWLSSLPEQDIRQTLILLLPASARRSHAQLKQKLQAAWPGKSRIEYHAENRLVMKYGDRLAEFDAETFVDNATLRLTAIESIPDSCRQLTDDAKKRLYDIFSQYFNNLNQKDREEQP